MPSSRFSLLLLASFSIFLAHGGLPLPTDPLLLDTPWTRDTFPPSGVERPKLYLITYSTRLLLIDCFSHLTAVQQNWVPNILGYYERLAYMGRQHFNEDKFISMGHTLRWLAEHDPRAVVVFADSSDVIYQLPPDVLMERYLSMGGEKVLFGAEANCWPPGENCGNGHPWVPPEVYEAGLTNLYPNTGTYIGRALDLYTIIYGCYWLKAERIMQGQPIPSYSYPNPMGEDQVMAYFFLFECPLDNPPRLDHFQDLFGLPQDGRPFEWTTEGYWARPQPSPLSLVSQALASVDAVHAARAYAPVLVHYNSASKFINDTFILNADRTLRRFAGGSGFYKGERYAGAPVNLVRLRRGTYADVCGNFLRGITMEYNIPDYMAEHGLYDPERYRDGRRLDGAGLRTGFKEDALQAT